MPSPSALPNSALPNSTLSKTPDSKTPDSKTQLRTALIAEDSLIHQKLAAALLAKYGIQATIVNNGEEAVVAARDFGFDLILMDIEMPILDGYEATRQIRNQESIAGTHTPIFAVTSLDDRKRALDAGMDAFISKPLSPSDLSRVLQDFVDSPAC